MISLNHVAIKMCFANKVNKSVIEQKNVQRYMYNINVLASFPASTPAFVACSFIPCERKSCGVEPGNEAIIYMYIEQLIFLVLNGLVITWSCAYVPLC